MVLQHPEEQAVGRLASPRLVSQLHKSLVAELLVLADVERAVVIIGDDVCEISEHLANRYCTVTVINFS